MSLVVFEGALMGCFILCELKDARKRDFLTLNMECISVHEYSLMFTYFVCYALMMVVDMKSRMNLYVIGLSHQ